MHGADAVLDLSLLQLKQWTKGYILRITLSKKENLMYL